MSNKQIKEKILDYDFDFEKLSIYLEENFNFTISGICDSLFYLFKFKNTNNSEIIENLNDNLILDLLISLETIVTQETDRKKIKKVDSELKYLQTKCNKYIEPSQKELIKAQLNYINNLKKILEKKKQDLEYEKIKIYENIIFNDRNLQRIELILKNNKKILNIKDSNNEDILTKILKIYVLLTEEQIEDINYFYQVILIFISNNNPENITNDLYNIIRETPNYLQILEEYKYKKHVKSLINKVLNTEKNPIKELEDKYQIELDYPEILLKELNYFNFDNKYRYDFTYQETITIDNAGTKCRDDAIYMEENKDGTYTLYMHKPNTASLIPYESLINKEAQFREETLYLIDRVSVMFPEKISYNLCSLLENVEKNTITYIVLLDNNMNIIENSLKIVRGKIIVKHKFSYDEVDCLLGNKPITKLDYMLKNLAIFSLKRKNITLKKEIYRKIENFVNENKHHESNYTDTSIAANIVHEISTLINYLPAKMFKENGLPYLYRIHDKPKDEILEKEINKILNYNTKNLDANTLEKIKKNLKNIYLTAEYSHIPGKHYGLDKEVYSHTNGTSRLYSGTFVQYITESIIIYGDYSNKNIYLWEDRTKEIAKILNERKQKIEAFCTQYNFNQYRKIIKNK